MGAYKGVLIFALSFLALIAGITYGFRALSHSTETSSCRSFAEATGYPTRFVDYSFLDFHCLVQTRGGNWSPLGE